MSSRSSQHIFDLLLSSRRRRRQLRRAHSGGIPQSTSAMMLVHLEQEAVVYASDLAALFGLEKSTVSRLLGGLRKKGFLRFASEENDKRRQRLLLTTSGRMTLEKVNAVQQKTLQEIFRSFSAEEVRKLVLLLQKLCDAAQCPVLNMRRAEHPFSRETRRLFRLFQHIEAVLAPRQLNIMDYQILSALDKALVSPNPTALAQHVLADLSTVSRHLKRLEQQRFIKKQSHSADRRALHFRLSEQGKTALRRAVSEIERLMGSFLAEFSERELQELEFLLQKSISEADIEHGFILQEEIRVRQIREVEELKLARAFVLERFVQTKTHLEAPEQICAKDSLVFSLMSAAKLIGVCEFQRRSENKLELCYAFLASIYNTPELLKKLIQTSLASLSPETSVFSAVPDLTRYLPRTLSKRRITSK